MPTDPSSLAAIRERHKQGAYCDCAASIRPIPHEPDCMRNTLARVLEALDEARKGLRAVMEYDFGPPVRHERIVLGRIVRVALKASE